MVSFAKIPDLLGYLVLTEYGAVLESDGDLKNDERCANLITSIINLTDNVDTQIFGKNECQKISIVFEQHSYTICLSNKKIYVVKRSTNQPRVTNQRSSSPQTSIAFQPDANNSNVEIVQQQQQQQQQPQSATEWVESA